MREIKFRGIDKHNGKIYFFTLEDVDIFKDKVGIDFDWNDFHISQSTGLKDKNGKEIYEGDIVKIVEDKNKKMANEPHQFKYGDIAKVEWSNTNLAYYLVNEKLEDIEIQMDYYGAWSGWNWLEIIGNIYKNPELLK